LMIIGISHLAKMPEIRLVHSAKGQRGLGFHRYGGEYYRSKNDYPFHLHKDKSF